MMVDKRLVHAIAQCADCVFKETDNHSAQKLGRDHHIKTGHQVTIETGYCQICERRTKEAKDNDKGKNQESNKG